MTSTQFYTNRRKRALIVQSGGGFSQAENSLGALRALAEIGVPVNDANAVDYRCTSAGALTAGLMMGGLTPLKAIAVVRDNPTDTLVHRKFCWPIRMFFGDRCVYDRSGLEALMCKYIPLDDIPNLQVSVTRIRRMQNDIIPGNYRSILASSSIDRIFPRTRLDREWYMDGGYTDNVPLEPWRIEQYRSVFIVLYPEDPNDIRHQHTAIGKLLQGFNAKLSQEVGEAARIYNDPVHYPTVTVLRPSPYTCSLLSWSHDFRLLNHSYKNAIQVLKARYPNGF